MIGMLRIIASGTTKLEQIDRAVYMMVIVLTERQFYGDSCYETSEKKYTSSNRKVDKTKFQS